MNNILNTILKTSSKGLYLINEIIPIYKDTNKIIKKFKKNITKEPPKPKEKNQKKENRNNPKFFV